MSLVIALGGARHNACAAAATHDRILGICGQERVTRVKGAAFNSSGFPDEVINELLGRAGRRRDDVSAYALAESSQTSSDKLVRLDHHFGHACAAFLPSPFESATVVICDADAPYISLWQGRGTEIARVDRPWQGPGLSEIYTRSAEALGFEGSGIEQRMEALARLNPAERSTHVDALFTLHGEHLQVVADWQARIAAQVDRSEQRRISIAASVQARIGDLLIEWLTDVARDGSLGPICLGGSLFFNSYFNSRVKMSGLFSDVFVPINTGNAGIAAGVALHVSGPRRQTLTPFLGPSFTAEDAKATLDNCKLEYDWASESEAINSTVDDLVRGRLVGWFEGGMEWGPRALGARSILASPLCRYVLNNLNQFLKKRDPWRGYALSGLEDTMRTQFVGPECSPFMECDAIPKDAESLANVLPGKHAAVRIQTVGEGAPIRFRRLLQAFGERTGLPILVNTSFNGFQEPIVCSPRDAIRVFYGTGLDTLVLEDFIVRK